MGDTNYRYWFSMTFFECRIHWLVQGVRYKAENIDFRWFEKFNTLPYLKYVICFD